MAGWAEWRGESEDVCAGYAVEVEVFKKYSPQESRNYLKFRGNPISIDTTKSDIPFVPPHGLPCGGPYHETIEDEKFALSNLCITLCQGSYTGRAAAVEQIVRNTLGMK